MPRSLKATSAFCSATQNYVPIALNSTLASARSTPAAPSDSDEESNIFSLGRYNLVQNEGQLNDVYGVIDLEEPLTNR